MTSYHTHTTWSDGRAGIDEMVAAGRQTGMTEVGLSDHYVLTPFPGETSAEQWSMPLPRVGEYVDEVLACRRYTSDIVVRLGLEADYFPETVGALSRILAVYPFDYVIGSVHYVDRFNVDGAAADWEVLSEDRVNSVYREYWRRVAALAETRLFDIVGHIDLPKKFGYRPTADLGNEIDAALAAVRNADMCIELNTSGWDKPCAEAYPDAGLLGQAQRLGIPVVLTGDCHAPGETARHFSRGTALLRDAGYTDTVRFGARERCRVPL